MSLHISKKDREIIRNKFGGRCAYTGTELQDDWQVDHVAPIIRNIKKPGALFEQDHRLDNMVPCQKIVNHYKANLALEEFRTWYIGELHLRLQKLPKNPRTLKGSSRKMRLLMIAKLFGITPEKPFSGKFYFEEIKEQP